MWLLQVAQAHASKSGVAPTVISVPKGPASVGGLGETFKPNLNTGTSTYAVRVKVPVGVGGHTPSVRFSYSSGAGNSDVGFAWSLGTPVIKVRTEKGVPRFDDTDTFMISGLGSGELVPLANGDFRLEVEKDYLRARRGADGWEVRTRSGQVYRFGLSPESRVEEAGQVSAWYLTDSYDTLGNHVAYHYEKHDGHPYLQTIVYNDFGPDVQARVAFEYEERPDVLSSYRAGFKVTLARRLMRVTSMVGDQLLAQYDLAYDEADALSRLASVTMVGTDETTALPTLQISYYTFAPADAQVVSMTTPPGRSPTDPNVTLTDLDGDSFPDLLVTSSGDFSYYLNDGGTSWEPAASMAVSPSVELGFDGVQLGDIDGNGRVDIIAKLGPGVGDFRYYPSDPGVGFSQSVPLTNNPPFAFEEPNVALLDVTGDGRSDVLRSAPGELIFYENLGQGAFADGVVLPEVDANQEVQFADKEHVRMADMNGDGLVDIVYLRDAGVTYWPSMGHGRFDQAVVMSGAPTLTGLQWVEVRDVNGDGLADVARVGVTMVEYWLNLGGATYAPRQAIEGTPYRDPVTTTVRFADMNGNGSQDIVWIDVSGTPADAWQYLDLLGAARPGLMRRIDNGLGKVTTVEYSSSGEMSAAARRDGDPWIHELPFPVQVVSRVTVSDSAGGEIQKTFAYRDGFYDGQERAFRGFGQSQQTDVGDEHSPTLLATSEFDVGETDKALAGRVLVTTWENAEGHVFKVDRNAYAVEQLAVGTNGRVVREARRTSSETDYVEGSTSPKTTRTEYEYDDYGNETVRREWGEVIGGDPAAGNDERFTFHTYAINEADWILDKVAEKRIEDGQGTVLRHTRTYYDGEDHQGLPLGQVSRGVLKRQQAWLGADDDRWLDSQRLAYDSYGNVISSIDSRGYERRTTYDDLSHRFATEETLVLDGREIQSRAGYDQLLGVVVWYETPNGNRVEYGYDPLGRLIHVVRPGDSLAYPTTTYTYTLASPISSVRREQRLVSGTDTVTVQVQHFDGFARLRSQRQQAADGQWLEGSATRYDARGRKAAVYRPHFVDASTWSEPDSTQPHTLTYYDAQGRVRRRVAPDGSETLTEYQPLARIAHDENDTDPTSPHFETPKTSLYDGLNRLVTVHEDAGQDGLATRHYQYDAASKLVRFEDPDGNARTYVYDGAGRLRSTHHPDAGDWTYHYDDGGNLTERIDPLGRRVLREYDGGKRLVREVHVGAGGEQQEFAVYHYDEAWDAHSGLANVVGRLGWVEDEAGVHAFGYDARGNISDDIRQVEGKRYELRFTRDAAERVTQVSYPDGAVIAYEHSPRSHVARIPGILTSQQIGPMGEVLGRTFENGVTVTRGHDERMRLTMLQSDGPHGNLQSIHLSYDRRGNVLSVQDQRTDVEPTLDRGLLATYDALDRLRHVEGRGYTVSWTYGLSDNIQRVETTGDKPALLVDGEFRYGEGGAGPHALTSVVRPDNTVEEYSYNGAGELTATPRMTVSYDDQGRISRIDSTDGRVIESGYGHNGQRVRRVVTSSGGRKESLYLSPFYEVRNGELVKYVVLNEKRIVRIGGPVTLAESGLQRVSDAGMVSPLGLLLLGSLLLLLGLLSWRRSIRPPLRATSAAVGVILALGVLSTCQKNSQTQGLITQWPGNALLILSDHLGSVHLLVDADGRAVAEQNHAPFGVLRGSSGEAPMWRGFTGKETDALDLVQIGKRTLLAGIGRWNRPDPLFLHEPEKLTGLNKRGGAYAYVQNNPLTMFDPTGENGKQAVDVIIIAQGVDKDEMKNFRSAAEAYQKSMGGPSKVKIIGATAKTVVNSVTKLGRVLRSLKGNVRRIIVMSHGTTTGKLDLCAGSGCSANNTSLGRSNIAKLGLNKNKAVLKNAKLYLLGCNAGGYNRAVNIRKNAAAPALKKYFSAVYGAKGMIEYRRTDYSDGRSVTKMRVVTRDEDADGLGSFMQPKLYTLRKFLTSGELVKVK